jgi:hypothetical protein
MMGPTFIFRVWRSAAVKESGLCADKWRRFSVQPVRRRGWRERFHRRLLRGMPEVMVGQVLLAQLNIQRMPNLSVRLPK